MRKIATLICLCLVLGCGNGQKEIDSAYRLAKSIESSIEIGITRYELRKKLQELNTATSIVNEKAASESEINKLKKLKEVVSIYKDSLVLWENLDSRELRGCFQVINKSLYNVHIKDGGAFDPSSIHTEDQNTKAKQIYDIINRHQNLIIETTQSKLGNWWVISKNSHQKLWGMAAIN